jgi:ribosomal protein L11 methyltransferase
MPVDEGSGAEPPASARTWPALEIDRLQAPDAELIEAALMDFDVSAIQETSDTSRCVFFTSAGDREAAARTIAAEFPGLILTSRDVPDDNWAARSQDSLTAVRVGRLIVAPPWDKLAELQGSGLRDQGSQGEPDGPGLKAQAGDAVLVVIRPSMGFGTGHHATTRLCLAALQQVALSGRTLIDVGTGSGVLAIAASLLGASDVVGLDDDADAIQAARENLELNPAARATLETGDVRATGVRTADVVTANLTGGLLVSAAPRLRTLVGPNGLLILSGLMAGEEQDVRAAFDGFDLAARTQEDEWLCLTLVPRAA